MEQPDEGIHVGLVFGFPVELGVLTLNVVISSHCTLVCRPGLGWAHVRFDPGLL